MGKIAANSNACMKNAQTVGDIVSHRHCPTFFTNDFVKIVLPILQEGEISAAGVLSYDGKLVGLLTERTILRHIFTQVADKTIHASNIKKYLDDITVQDAMISEPETLDDNIPIEEAAGMMLRRGYRYMPVVSRMDRNRLLGIVSERELAHYLKDRLQEVKQLEKQQRSMLSYLLSEPYGCGYDPALA